MSYLDDDAEGLEEFSNDICPNCGATLDGYGELGEGCDDPMGCGAWKETFEDLSDDEYEEDEELLEELNFDEE